VEERGIVLGIHVRRTDQLTTAHGARDPGVGYFKTALKLLGAIGPAVVCTDDADWVRAQSVFDGMYIRNGSDPAHEVVDFD
jgi:hypothetical protein